MRTSLIVAALSAATLLCVGATVAPNIGPAGAAVSTVHLGSGFTFSPASVTVHVGDTVTWVHDASATEHTVTADDSSFDSSPSCPTTCMGANATFSHTFAAAGTFRYYCKIHGGPGGIGMSATIVVAAAPPTTSAPTTAPSTSAPGGGSVPPTSATAAPGATVAAAADPTLAHTGSSTLPLLLAGIGAVALGLGLRFGARRRPGITR